MSINKISKISKISKNLANLILIVEIIYIVYILRYFKTTQSFSFYPQSRLIDKFEINIGKYLSHNVYNTTKPEHHICPFGRDGAILMAIYLLIRLYCLSNNYKWSWTLNKVIVLVIFLLAWMNLNAIIYLIPFFIWEIYLSYSGILKP